jgi:hypothetical protein
MSRYRPGLDDDRLVGEALEALAQDTEHIEAPPAVEARLRAAFRSSAGSAPAPAPPSRSNAWKWVATVGVAAGLVWVAYAATRTEPPSTVPAREVAGGEAPAVSAPRESAPPVARIAPAPPRAPRVASRVDVARPVRVAANEPSRASQRAARPAPRVERFEPLYPGDPLADLDAVHLVRVSVPRSALATLGWPSRPGARDDRVELDAMVGPDGMTRAVRFISQ